MRRSFLFALVAVLALPVAAQNTDIESLSGLQFNLGNPGARSLGMGGAFLGLADDASAAEANPAGLTILRKPEISIEGRNYLERQLFTTSGTFPDLNRTGFTNHSDRIQLAFASAVFPIGSRFTLGAYFHEPLRNEGVGIVAPEEGSFGNPGQSLPNFFLPRDNPTGPVTQAQCETIRSSRNDPFACIEYQFFPFASALDVKQQTFGLAGAWQVHPKFSVGASARYQTFTERAFTLIFNDDFDVQAILAQGTGTVNALGTDLEIGTETDVTFTGGFKWSPSEKISIGGVYKQGPKFLTPSFFAGEQSDNELIQLAETSFHMPDIAGLGISVRPIPVLTINVDAVQVWYSNLADEFFSPRVGDLGDQAYEIEDVLELRVGAEYFFSTKIPIAVRAGYWRDPAHSLTYRGPLDTFNRIGQAALYPKGEDQDHFSVGAGLAWPRFQIDAAYDTSDNFKVGSISMVTRF